MVVRLKDIKNKVISGIYKLNFPNGKTYIGQSQNIYKRVLEHNQRSRKGRLNRDIQLCEKAIQKYGEIDYFEIIEECDISELDTKEDYWIEYYDSIQNGYNLLDYGDVSGRRGTDNYNAAFSPEELQEIFYLLKNTNLSYQQIGEKYSVDKNTIYNINKGTTYTQDIEIYPIRKYMSKPSLKKETIEDYFISIEQLLELKDDLLNRWDLNIENDLYNKYPNVSLKTIREVNQGRLFPEIGGYKSYPLRTKKTINQNHLSYKQVQNILEQLKNTTNSMQDIGKQYNISRATISKINKGIICPIKNYSYPARRTR